MGQSTVVASENTSRTVRESDNVFWCNNNVWYTCREAVKFFQEHGDGALYHAEDNVRNVFKTQNVDVETGTMLGAHINALVMIGNAGLHTHDFSVVLQHVNCSYFTPDIMETIANFCVGCRESHGKVEHLASVILIMVSRGNSVHDAITSVSAMLKPGICVVSAFREAYAWVKGIGEPVYGDDGTVNCAAMISALIDHMGHSRLSFIFENNALTTSKEMMSDFLSGVLYENPESRDAAVAVFDELMSLPPHTAYHIVSTSSLYPVELFDAAFGEQQSSTTQIQWMNKGLSGYRRCVSVVPDSLEHGTTTADPTMKSAWGTCVEKTFERTTISRDLLNLVMFYTLSVPPSHRSMVMENMDYIMDRFVTYCNSLDGDVLERVKESAYWIIPDITVVPDCDEPVIFSPVAMAVVCATAGDDISLWCDMVLTMLGCDVISLHGADTMMFIVDNHDVVCDFPLLWVETMGRSYCQ